MNTASFIGGRYRVEGRIGVGGMSTVMLAVDERLEREVAVKLLAEHLADDPTFVSRFRREALAAARLVHPNIVQVFDSGFDEAAHQHFIVMEYVRGLSCAEILRERGHLDVERAVDIVEQACRGLDYAHRNGVVHRDVKPGNLLVSESNVVKLADFGIARATGQTSITQVGSVLGTAAYLSPEQARGEEAGPQADLYSLGVVTYQLLSGRLPYEATSLSELALKQQREAPIPLQRLNPRVPAALAEAVALAISIVSEERPHTAVELSQLIEDGANGISPYDSEGPTRHMGASDAATTVMRGGDYATQETAVTRPVAPRPVAPRSVAPRTGRARTPRTVPSRQTAPREPTSRRPQAQAPEPRSASRKRKRGARRVVMAMAMLLVLAVVAIVIAVAVHQTASTVKAEKVVARDAQRAIDKVQTIISNNTK
jgi:eukaryotic-like serine/threonine-protein kinase